MSDVLPEARPQPARYTTDEKTPHTMTSCGVSKLAMEVLVGRQGDHPPHVFTYNGNTITQVNTKAWRNALKRAWIEDLRSHLLRHTFATWHREAGTPTHELQRLGGWKTQSMVERYAHVAPEGLQCAATRLDSVMESCGVSQVFHRPERLVK
jgi:integrase